MLKVVTQFKVNQQNGVFWNKKKIFAKENILDICQMFVSCNVINPIGSNDNRFSEIQLLL